MNATQAVRGAERVADWPRISATVRADGTGTINGTGRILVTDHGSGNGTESQTNPPRLFEAHVPYVLAAGTTLRLGDVICRVDLVGTPACRTRCRCRSLGIVEPCPVSTAAPGEHRRLLSTYSWPPRSRS